MTRRLFLAALLVLGGSISCGDSNAPVAGALKVSLTTPNNGQDGAIQFVIAGPVAITAVAAAPGLRVFADTLGTVTRVVVTGTLTTGLVASVGVADVSQLAQYSATIQQVAATNYQLRPRAGYALAVTT